MLLVLVPVRAVLGAAHVLVADGPVHEQHGEVGAVEVGHGGHEARGEAPAQGHEPVPRVVDLARHAPPARDHELGPALGGHVLDVLGLGAVRVGAEDVLLQVGAAEDGVAQALERYHANEGPGRQLGVVRHEESRLQAVGEGHPAQVPKREHEAKAVRGDVHGREDGLFKVERVPDVEALEGRDDGHGRAHRPRELVLAHEHADVEHGPADEPRPQLAEGLQVQGAHARVELAADEEVVDGDARVAALGEERALAEGGEVEVG
mmetsp:Transcript_22790/g.67155  ORF Transcript_22790/g.67155 Transcript_22790/m.67155 type:complete len:263 (-) Transcript_22790:137-925(-)